MIGRFLKIGFLPPQIPIRNKRAARANLKHVAENESTSVGILLVAV
jgi:hypothetical protein